MGGGSVWPLRLACPAKRPATPCLPSCFAAVVLSFAPLFRHRSWRHAEVLLIGAILAPGTRTLACLLRLCGLMRERRFVKTTGC